MTDNTVIIPGIGGDNIRDLDRLTKGVKTQVVQLDIGGPSTAAENLINAGQDNMANSLPVTLASDQPQNPFDSINANILLQQLQLQQATAINGFFPLQTNPNAYAALSQGTTGTGSTVATTAFTPINKVLANWFRNGVTGKTVCFIGDSTISNATEAFIELALYADTGEALSGCTILNYGENGASTLAFLNNQVTHGITTAIAAAADLYIFDYGINDVRLGGTTQAQLEGLIEQVVTTMRAALPNADFVLQTPFAFLSDDPGSTGYVVPLASAQAYSTILRKAYQTMIGQWPNVYVWDRQVAIGGTTCLPSTVNTIMTDILHPGSALQKLWVDRLVTDVIGQGVPGLTPVPYSEIAPGFYPGRTDAALLMNPAQPWLVYPRCVEDTRYFTKIVDGSQVGGSAFANSGNGFVDITSSDPASKVNPFDIVQLGSQACFVIPTSASIAQQSTTDVRISNLGASQPSVTGNMSISVYRALYGDGTYAYDPQVKRYLTGPDYPYQRLINTEAGAGTNFVRIGINQAGGVPSPVLYQTAFDPADLLLFSGYNGATVSAAGSGYSVSDTITLSNGAVVTVLTLSGSAVATVALTSQPSQVVSNPAAQVSSSGPGTGATINLSNTPIPIGFITVVNFPGNDLQYGPTGNWSAQNNRIGWVVGLGVNNSVATENAFAPVVWNLDGAVTTVTQFRIVQRGGQLFSVRANLNTSSSSGSVTATMSMNGTLGLTLTWAQGATGQPGTITFNLAGNAARCSSTSVVVIPGDILTWTITAAGIGASNISVSLDL